MNADAYNNCYFIKRIARNVLATLYLALVTGSVFADQAVKVTKTVPKKNGKVLIKVKCAFRISEKVPIGEAQFTLTMDTALRNLKSRQVSVVSEEGTAWVVENKKPMKPNRFTALFSGLYIGDVDTPVPTGTCSDLSFPGATTTEYSVVARLEADTSEGRCHTVQAACSLQVDVLKQPDTVFFNLTFSGNVGRFQDNYGTYISQASEPGRWIYTSNKFQLEPGTFVYAFQITYHGDTEPDVHCNSILPPSDRK